jgi:DNA-dependent metalloprotease WSS1
MPKWNTNIKTIADFANNNNYHENNIENDSPNVPSDNTLNRQQFISSSSSLDSSSNTNSKPNATSVSTSDSMNNLPNCYHIPTFTNEQPAKILLNRIVQEFIPIIQRRKYNILSISELCCCSDGLDYTTTTTTTNNKRRRKIRKVSNNIWGYNRTVFNNYSNKQHTIHIRLRHPTNHQLFLSYEDIAGTLAHELSHCVYGPHDTKFFQLMDTILDEHASIMASKLSSSSSSSFYTNNNGTSNHPIPFSGTGQLLGSALTSTMTSHGTTSSEFKNAGTTTDTGHVLGGDRTFIQFMSPKEVAVIAAETRRRQQQLRLRGDHCCRPCNNDENDENDVDDDDDDDDDENEYNVVEENKKEKEVVTSTSSDENESINVMKRPYYDIIKTDQTIEDKKVSKRIPILSTNSKDISTSGKNILCIDLTLDSDDDDNQTLSKTSIYNATKNNTYPNSQSKQIDEQTWICHRCTYRNPSKSDLCDMCVTTREL